MLPALSPFETCQMIATCGVQSWSQPIATFLFSSLKLAACFRNPSLEDTISSFIPSFYDGHSSSWSCPPSRVALLSWSGSHAPALCGGYPPTRTPPLAFSLVFLNRGAVDLSTLVFVPLSLIPFCKHVPLSAWSYPSLQSREIFSKSSWKEMISYNFKLRLQDHWRQLFSTLFDETAALGLKLAHLSFNHLMLRPKASRSIHEKLSMIFLIFLY